MTPIGPQSVVVRKPFRTILGARSWRGLCRAGHLSVLVVLLGCTLSTEALAAPSVPYRYEKALTERLTTTLQEAVPAGFTKPWGLAFNSAGSLFVADTGLEPATSGVVDKFDPTDGFLAQLGGSPPVLTGEFTRDAAVSDESGHVYVADSNHSEVIVMGAAGEELSRWTGKNTGVEKGFGENCCFVYDAVDNSTSASRGDVYVMTNKAGGEVDVFAPQGEDKEEGKFLRKLEPPAGGFSFDTANAGNDGLAVNGSSGPEAGVVYVVDSKHKVVDRFSAAGILEASHQLKGPSGEAFQEPSAVAVDDATGNVFVADEGARAVDAFSPTGEMLAQIKESEPGEPLRPLGVAVQRAGALKGDVYVSDFNKRVVRVFGPQVREAPTIAEAGATEVSGDSATLTAQLDPHGETTNYRFEYGPCITPLTCSSSPYEHSVPSPEGTVGGEDDFEPHHVDTHLQGLAPGATYHFLIIAHNVQGEVKGEERTFTTQGPGGELVLPDARQWELVSPPDKHGGSLGPGINETGIVEASASGDAVTYLADAPTEAAPAGYADKVQVLSTRGVGGWGSRDIGVPHQHETGGGAGLVEHAIFADDLRSAIVLLGGVFNPALSVEASEQTPYVQSLASCAASCYRPLVTGKLGYADVPPGTSFGEELACEEEHHSGVFCGPYVLDATGDLAHVVLESAAPLETGVPRNELYEWSGGTLQMISVLPPNGAGEELPAPAATARLGANFGGGYGSARRVISSDGTRVFWADASLPVAPGEALYVRDTETHRTLELDTAEPGCAGCESGGGRFQLASADGSRVLFTDARRLTSDAGAAPGKPDLYECRLVVGETGGLSCGPDGPVDLTPSNGGEPASVQGDVLGAGEDAGTAYLVADGTLGAGPNTRGQSPIPGQPNLYVLAGGPPSFIATLATGDDFDWTTAGVRLPTRISPSGNWLSFLSERSLTGYDNHDAASGRPDAELYLYNAATQRLLCASCDPTGARPVGTEYKNLTESGSESLVAGNPSWESGGWVAAVPPVPTAFNLSTSVYQSRYLSDAGRLFFNSLDALVPQDVNGNWDVYQFEPAGLGSCSATSTTYAASTGGCTGLISSGASPQQSAFLDASGTGADVFFMTSAKLTGQDVDAAFDVYDAHECTVASPCIPPPPVAPPPCITEASCRPAPTPQPSIFGAPSSATFQGPGNLTPPPASPPKVETRAQKLAKALKACRNRYPHATKRRRTCEHQARRKYGAHTSSTVTNQRRSK